MIFSEISLLVRAKNDGSILLTSKILLDTAYQKIKDTFIVWCEFSDLNFALRFQKKSDRNEIWKKICEVQGKDPTVDTTKYQVEEPEDEQFKDKPAG